ncbi:tetratricopeptide repeat protein [Psychrosphaera haliotis]|uniref:Flagellar protein MotX n=1 Tax=Psychrosphaera haliotis TaxID=555083 RepID=A0A6N8FF15_9GAMM|nr:tetratricopeptide repeat protein [Psychrosphaera haliotis]MUH72841.1 flagellar protein MotX [Psychrosphaera haliotis]
MKVFNYLLVTLSSLALLACSLFSARLYAANDEPLQAVQIYTQDELLDLIKQNKHLDRVKADRCQLTRDIEDRAVKLHLPSYEFLYGDMLAWGVCVEQNAELGMYYIRESAKQGLVAAIEQLGRYYHVGRFVQKDSEKAYTYILRAAELGNLQAQLRLIDLQLAGVGSPYDFENAYRWLHHAIIADEKLHSKATRQLKKLEKLMHPKSVKAAKAQ